MRSAVAARRLPRPALSRPAAGALFCIASGAAFGAMAVFGKLAYDAGATVGTLLGVRFTLAAAMFWVLIPLREIRALPRRDIGTGLALVVLGEKLGAIQLLGGALVLAAVIPATLAATRARIPVTQR